MFVLRTWSLNCSDSGNATPVARLRLGRVQAPMVAARNLPEDIVWASLRLARSRGDIFAPGEGGPEVAQKVSVTFACDYDQKEIPVGQHRTRGFGLDGRDYEIDLCAKHSQKLDEVVNRYADRKSTRLNSSHLGISYA